MAENDDFYRQRDELVGGTPDSPYVLAADFSEWHDALSVAVSPGPEQTFDARAAYGGSAESCSQQDLASGG